MSFHNNSLPTIDKQMTYSIVFAMCQFSTKCMDANSFVNIILNRFSWEIIWTNKGVLTENQENREQKCLKYTQYRQNSVHPNREKMTRLERCTVKTYLDTIDWVTNQSWINCKHNWLKKISLINAIMLFYRSFHL